LIVEDNTFDVETELRALEKVNLADRVCVMRNGAEALKYLFSADGKENTTPPHLPLVIFLDLEMPLVNGLEVLKRVKSDPRTQKIPVVILTSIYDSEHVRQAYDSGANSYIVKPHEPKNFRDSVGQMGLYWIGLNQSPP